MRSNVIAAAVLAAACGAAVAAQEGRPMSGAGTAAAHVRGQWVKPKHGAQTLGSLDYEGGKWIEITYGRPLRRYFVEIFRSLRQPLSFAISGNAAEHSSRRSSARSCRPVAWNPSIRSASGGQAWAD